MEPELVIDPKDTVFPKEYRVPFECLFGVRYVKEFFRFEDDAPAVYERQQSLFGDEDDEGQ